MQIYLLFAEAEYLWFAPWMLCLGIIKLALASALDFSYLYVAGHGRFRSLRIFCRKIRVTMKTAKRMKRVLGWLLVCLPVAAGAQSVQDSLAIAAIRWDTCCVRPHLVAVQAQLELFGAPQAISMVRYDAGRYRTRIVQPDSLTLTSVLAEAEGAVAAVNAGYFNVKTLVPSTFVRVGGRTVAATEAREEFRVNGVVAIKGRRVRIEPYVPADDARLARRYRDALAAGPLLLCRGEALSYADREGGFWGRHPRSVVGVTRRGEAVMIVVDGRFPGQAAGMTIGELIYLVRQLGLYSALNLDGGGSSTLWCEEAGVVNRPSDNRRFDHEGERRVTNCIAVVAERRRPFRSGSRGVPSLRLFVGFRKCPPPSRICGKAETACFHVGLNVLLSACRSA